MVASDPSDELLTTSRRNSAPGKTASSVLIVLFLLGTAAIQGLSPQPDCQACAAIRPAGKACMDSMTSLIPALQDEEYPEVVLIRAQAKLNSTQQDYERIQRLSAKGSASGRSLRLANVRWKIAELDYASLVDPLQAEPNEILKSRVVLRFHESDFAVIQELFEKGSVSELKYRRAKSTLEVAAGNLKILQSTSDVQRKMQMIKIAKSRFQLAEFEFRVAQRLFSLQSFSQFELDRASTNLEMATSELAASKASLGARAVQSKQ